MVPEPVTTPSAGKSLPSMPKVVQRCFAKPSRSWKRGVVDQDVDALAGGEVSGGVVLGDAVGAAAQHQHVAALLEFEEAIGHRDGCRGFGGHGGRGGGSARRGGVAHE